MQTFVLPGTVTENTTSIEDAIEILSSETDLEDEQ
jgi:hypothetical protein